MSKQSHCFAGSRPSLGNGSLQRQGHWPEAGPRSPSPETGRFATIHGALCTLWLGTAGAFVIVAHGSGDQFVDRFWPPSLLGWDRIQVPAGRAFGTGSANSDSVPSQEAGWPNWVEKLVPGAACDCYKGPGDAKYGAVSTGNPIDAQPSPNHLHAQGLARAARR